MLRATSESYITPSGEGDVIYWSHEKLMYITTWVENTTDSTIEPGDVVELGWDDGQLIIIRKIEVDE